MFRKNEIKRHPVVNKLIGKKKKKYIEKKIKSHPLRKKSICKETAPKIRANQVTKIKQHKKMINNNVTPPTPTNLTFNIAKK